MNYGSLVIYSTVWGNFGLYLNLLLLKTICGLKDVLFFFFLTKLSNSIKEISFQHLLLQIAKHGIVFMNATCSNCMSWWRKIFFLSKGGCCQTKQLLFLWRLLEAGRGMRNSSEAGDLPGPSPLSSFRLKRSRSTYRFYTHTYTHTYGVCIEDGVC